MEAIYFLTGITLGFILFYLIKKKESIETKETESRDININIHISPDGGFIESDGELEDGMEEEDSSEYWKKGI